jgi:hypothetical protein
MTAYVCNPSRTLTLLLTPALFGVGLGPSPVRKKMSRSVETSIGSHEQEISANNQILLHNYADKFQF